MPNNPYRMILEAGRIRTEAARSCMKADALEANVRVELDLGPTTDIARTLTPGTATVIVYGGECGGRVERMSMDSLKEPMLVPKGGANPIPYLPAVMLQMHGLVVGAIIVPKRGRVEFHEQVRKSDGLDEVACVMAQMVVETLGMNTELVSGIVKQITVSIASCPEAIDGPAMLVIGEMHQ